MKATEKISDGASTPAGGAIGAVGVSITTSLFTAVRRPHLAFVSIRRDVTSAVLRSRARSVAGRRRQWARSSYLGRNANKLPRLPRKQKKMSRGSKNELAETKKCP
ncbi:hypothetical protein EVAR_92577_1 [Eumeta japonica]|uniref:Uncharacterized protein n=1 Tax=Eumeta variegata TaxID=151549 RepID=A0A4C1SZG9_EUMVA|nr:hypothetical protein EVAR_92577_1 [Eumeta japonica]